MFRDDLQEFPPIPPPALVSPQSGNVRPFPFPLRPFPPPSTFPHRPEVGGDPRVPPHTLSVPRPTTPVPDGEMCERGLGPWGKGHPRRRGALAPDTDVALTPTVEWVAVRLGGEGPCVRDPVVRTEERGRLGG